MHISRLRQRIRDVDEAATDNFLELVRIAGLDPAKHFRFADLQGVELTGLDLAGFDFTGAILTQSSLRDALTEHAIFTDAQLDGADLTGTHLADPERPVLADPMGAKRSALPQTPSEPQEQSLGHQSEVPITPPETPPAMAATAKSLEVPIHGAAAFESLRRAGKLAAETLDMIANEIKVGVTTERLDKLAHMYILDNGATPGILGLRGFPKATTININEQVCNCIPGSRKLQLRDTLSLDATVLLDGWYCSSSRMYFPGEPPTQANRLCQAAFEALWRGIRAVKPGATLGDLGYAIQSYVEDNGYSVVRDYCGFGTGRVSHDIPSVLHYGKRGTGLTLRPGMVFTIIPMINVGAYQVKLNRKDGWTVTTRDGKRSAQFKHTVGVTEDGVEVFTLSPAGLDHPVW